MTGLIVSFLLAAALGLAPSPVPASPAAGMTPHQPAGGASPPGSGPFGWPSPQSYRVVSFDELFLSPAPGENVEVRGFMSSAHIGADQGLLFATQRVSPAYVLLDMRGVDPFLRQSLIAGCGETCEVILRGRILPPLQTPVLQVHDVRLLARLR